MGEQITITAADGHEFTAWRAGTGPGLVVIQEIFGVNSHIRNTTERFAAQGFTAVAPALFDRLGPDIELGYESDDVAKGRDLRGQIANEDAMKDIAATIALLSGEGLRVGCVGYCWGGSLAWASATGLDNLSASVCYYGGEIPNNAAQTPRCPVMMHFGEHDHGIPLDGVEAVRKAHPAVPIHIYDAGHGFSCDERASFDQASHEQALARTLPFLKAHLGA
jgi:carboxymethylenebutenolidase